ncbi:Exopolysaccharide synthesis, ExoD [Methylobrevis pamukkalensis]|uniref:Exopolysaccharide synthesis, ExoD n=1 Tax=Methylobrevis pamukkalensis TaxID=1439726 RepID=A0A1E3H2L8_9HYPH|nr:Exopolysaccharide synthesis, ExoD [Methylobrevis pamukkalensis]
MMLGSTPWLPAFISKRSMARSDFARIIEKVSPWLAKAERLMKPRLSALAYPPGQNLAGALCLLLSLVLFLPIPGGNMLPALACCLIALGLLERDASGSPPAGSPASPPSPSSPASSTASCWPASPRSPPCSGECAHLVATDSTKKPRRIAPGLV